MKYFQTAFTFASAATAFFAPVSGECDFEEADIVTELDIFNSTVGTNTLHLEGGELRYKDVATFENQKLDLRVTVTDGDYTDINEVWDSRGKNATQQNGKVDGSSFGNINLQTVKDKPKSGEGNFRFCLVEEGTDEPVTLQQFSWTIFDLDERGADTEGKKIKEKFIMDVSQAELFQVVDGTEVKISCEDGSDLPCAPGIRTVFHSSTAGTGPDNPKDPNDLSSLQQKRSVAFLFKDTSCWEFTYDHYCPVDQPGNDPGLDCRSYTGGNFLFSGNAPQIIDDGECNTASPTVSPTLAPVNPPTPSPTASPTGVPTSEPTGVPTTAATTSTPTSHTTHVPTSATTSIPTSAPTGSPVDLPTSSPTTTPTAQPTSEPTNGPTSEPTGVPTTAATTSTPTSHTTHVPTPATTAIPTSAPTSSPTEEPEFTPPPPPPACPEDVELIKIDGVTKIDLGKAVQVINQAEDKSTVTVRLSQAWTEGTVDHIFYEYSSSDFDSQCTERTNVGEGAVYTPEDITLKCMHTKPIAELGICVAHARGGFLNHIHDGATVPKCCHPDLTPGDPVVCYKILVRCETRCVDAVARRGLRGAGKFLD